MSPARIPPRRSRLHSLVSHYAAIVPHDRKSGNRTQGFGQCHPPYKKAIRLLYALTRCKDPVNLRTGLRGDASPEPTRSADFPKHPLLIQIILKSFGLARTIRVIPCPISLNKKGRIRKGLTCLPSGVIVKNRQTIHPHREFLNPASGAEPDESSQHP